MLADVLVLPKCKGLLITRRRFAEPCLDALVLFDVILRMFLFVLGYLDLYKDDCEDNFSTGNIVLWFLLYVICCFVDLQLLLPPCWKTSSSSSKEQIEFWFCFSLGWWNVVDGVCLPLFCFCFTEFMKSKEREFFRSPNFCSWAALLLLLEKLGCLPLRLLLP